MDELGVQLTFPDGVGAIIKQLHISTKELLYMFDPWGKVGGDIPDLKDKVPCCLGHSEAGPDQVRGLDLVVEAVCSQQGHIYTWQN